MPCIAKLWLPVKHDPGQQQWINAEAEGWLIRTDAQEDRVLAMLRDEVDAGEAEAIRLAIDRLEAVVLLDDTAARAIAKRLGLKVTGTLGILLRAKQLGFVTRLQPLIEQMRADGRFYIAPAIVAQVLAAAEE
jgi:predicted nucleic acid-binding protein